MRHFLMILLLTALAPSAAADHVILTGGPALRKWEDLRVSQDQHDRWWANFIRGATIRMDELRKAYGPGARIVWIVYRDGYQSRAREDGDPYTTWITGQARKRGATLRWFGGNRELINTLNSLPRGSVQSFDFFGHSNKYCFMLDYGNKIMAASTVWLHENDLSRIKRSIFARDAYCKSWGCHTGESMSRKWSKRFGVPLEGAIGSTDYRVVGKGKLPAVQGRWAR